MEDDQKDSPLRKSYPNPYTAFLKPVSKLDSTDLDIIKKRSKSNYKKKHKNEVKKVIFNTRGRIMDNIDTLMTEQRISMKPLGNKPDINNNEILLLRKRSSSLNLLNPIQKEMEKVMRSYKKILKEKLLLINKESSSLVTKVTFSLESNSRYRDHMEDCINIENVLNEHGNKQKVYILCDGHSGEFAAKNIIKLMPEVFKKHLDDFLNKKIDTVEQAIEGTFVEMDNILKELEENLEDEEENSGSTVNIVYICFEKGVRVVYSGNVGDSRTVLVRKNDVKRLSYDHKASDEEEKKRVKKEGGIIMKNRFFGTLAITRALADFEFKDGVEGLSNIPHITRTEVKDDDTYIVMGSDGVWDVIDDNNVKELINEFKTNNKDKCFDLATYIVKKSVDYGSRDNISCITICLR